MKRIIMLLAVVSLLLAQKKKVRFDESFDPATLKEPEIKLPVILKPDEPLPPQFSPVETETVVEGYRQGGSTVHGRNLSVESVIRPGLA
ncbi:MAG TPA: hypothetical protein EYO92_01625, partial [Candidatus Marinimicrobia bacterium]|nr:hypothetical protein [Candidatus Neomarinimicrobiota bacterium]